MSLIKPDSGNTQVSLKTFRKKFNNVTFSMRKKKLGVANRPKLLKLNMYVERFVFLLRIDVLQWQSYEHLSKTTFCQFQQSLQIRNNNVIGQLCSHIINDEIITGKTFTNLASVNLINMSWSSAYKYHELRTTFILLQVSLQTHW